MSRAGQFRYYIQLWNAESGAYSVPRSAASVVQELELDEKAFPFTSRTGAFLIGEELRRRGGALPRKTSPLFADYCAEIWNWDSSPYVRGKLARGQSIGRKYVADNLARVENHIRLAFPDLRLAAVKPYMLEDFAMKLKTDSGLGNRSINAILDTMAVPLHEAARLGLIPSDPASTVRKLGNDTREKGIPTEEEVRALLGLSGIDSRIRAAILLGAACALRIGEIQALRNENIGAKTLTVACSWSNMDGLKSTKTGRVRVVPLPPIIRSALLELMEENPQGSVGFLMYGLKPDAPLDVRAIERGFYKALEKIGIDEEKRTARALSFHSLRHWSNAMLRGSVSDAKLHLLTGHSTEAMTNRYDHATEADLAELAQAQEAKILPFLADSRARGTMENAVIPKAAGGEV